MYVMMFIIVITIMIIMIIISQPGWAGGSDDIGQIGTSGRVTALTFCECFRRVIAAYTI